jgi:hypothetical protein
MVRADSTEFDGGSTLVDLSRVSFSVDVLQSGADCAQMQEQIPTHPVPPIRVWDGSSFFMEKLPENLFTLSQTTQTGHSIHDVLPTYL